MKFRSLLNNDFPFNGEDLSRVTEYVYSYVNPISYDLSTGECLNKDNVRKLVKTGEINIDEKINSYADDVDFYKMFDKFQLTGDSSFIRRRVGWFGDLTHIPDNINDFNKKMDSYTNTLKSTDTTIASAILGNQLTDLQILNMIKEKINNNGGNIND